MNEFDVIVIGGGMVGSAVAAALAQKGRRVALVESHRPEPFDDSQSMDLRVSAISPASQHLLMKLGAWELIETMRLCPYRELHTWEDDHQPKLRFTASEIDRDYLGHIVENRIIQLALWQICNDCGVTMIESSDWQLQQNEQGVRVTTESQVIIASLAVGADGANSKVRESAGIGLEGWDYGQHCLTMNVRLDAPQQDITWQKFFPSGPRALLPLPDQQAALIWYDDRHKIERLNQLSNEHLQSAVVDAFPALPGDIEVLSHASFPLTRRHALRYFQHRIVLVGDAAHTINPLAGQGVNLGFKDVKVLIESLDGVDLSINPEPCLHQYQQQRRKDNLLMQTAMDFFYQAFSTRMKAIKLLRGAGLQLAQASGPIKREALRYALGL